MLIPVVYPNGSHDLVKDFYLSHLISSRKIDRFKRDSGWVDIDSSNVREKNQPRHYNGPERRESQRSVEKADSESSATFRRVKPFIFKPF